MQPLYCKRQKTTHCIDQYLHLQVGEYSEVIDVTNHDLSQSHALLYTHKRLVKHNMELYSETERERLVREAWKLHTSKKDPLTIRAAAKKAGLKDHSAVWRYVVHFTRMHVQ